MSKLSDKIRKASRMEALPLGFMAARAAKEPTMLLCGVAKDARGAAELARHGADFVIVTGGGKAVAPGDAKELDGTIAGAWIEGDTDAQSLKEGGFDFVVFDADKTASTAVLSEDVGYVMTLPKDASDMDLRSLEGFALDAIDIGAIKGGLTVRRHMELRRVSALTRKPLLVSLPDGDMPVKQLQALRDTNVIAVAAESAAVVEQLRKTIDALPPRSRRKDEERPSPLVPATAAGGEHEHEEEDEGEDE